MEKVELSWKQIHPSELNKEVRSGGIDQAEIKELAKKRGTAIGIGHPYPATLALLEREIPKLRDDGIELISINELVLLKHKQMTGNAVLATGPVSRASEETR